MIVRVRLTAPLGALRERNLALLVGSTGISTLGTGMAQVALAFAVLKIGTATDLGYVLVAREIPIVVFLLLGGVWADRVSRHRLLVGGDLISGAAQATGAGLLLVGGATVWNLALLQIAFGVASAFTRPASVGLVPQVVKPEHLQQANALIDLSRSTLRIAGPAIGGAIVVAANPGWALAVDAATFFVSALMRGAMRIPKAADHVRGVGIVADLRDGWREFVSRSWVWAMVAGFGVFQLTLFPALLVLGPSLRRRISAARVPGEQFSPARQRALSPAAWPLCACASAARWCRTGSCACPSQGSSSSSARQSRSGSCARSGCWRVRGSQRRTSSGRPCCSSGSRRTRFRGSPRSTGSARSR
jgi:hypothetical protein